MICTLCKKKIDFEEHSIRYTSGIQVHRYCQMKLAGLNRFTAGAKRVITNVSKNPDHYKEMSAKRKKKYKHLSHLKENDPETLKKVASKGGRTKLS